MIKSPDSIMTPDEMSMDVSRLNNDHKSIYLYDINDKPKEEGLDLANPVVISNSSSLSKCDSSSFEKYINPSEIPKPEIEIEESMLDLKKAFD